MKTVKFRGQRLDNKEWVYGYYVVIGGDHYIAPNDDISVEDNIEHKTTFIAKRVDPATVGQFTGLLDKNGKEIYEGDVLRHDDKINMEQIVSPVIWNPAYFTSYGIMGVCDWDGNETEVIGNIYENPELLKEKL